MIQNSFQQRSAMPDHKFHQTPENEKENKKKKLVCLMNTYSATGSL